MVSFVDKAFYSCLLFTEGAGRRSEDNWAIFGLFLYIFIMIVGLLGMYVPYRFGVRFPKTIAALRGPLFLFCPTFVINSLTIELSFLMEQFFRGDECSLTVQFSIFFAILVIVATHAVSFWVLPLLARTPLCSIGPLPSRILPEMTVLLHFQIYAAAGALVTSMAKESGTMAFGAFSFVFGIWVIVDIGRSPFTLKLDTVLHIVLGCAYVMSPFGATAQRFIKDCTPEAVLGVEVAVMVICAIVAYYVLNKTEKKWMRHAFEMHYDNIRDSQIIAFTQLLVQLNGLTPEFVDVLKETYARAPDHRILILYGYCWLLASQQYDSDVLDLPLTALVETKGISWAHRFVAFEIYRSFAQTLSLPLPLPGFDELNDNIGKYKEMQNNFWTNMMTGDINKGIIILYKMSKLYMRISHAYEKLYAFYVRHPKVYTLEMRFFKFVRKHMHPNAIGFTAQGFSCDVRKRYFRYIGKKDMTLALRKEETTTSTCTDSTEERNSVNMTENLHKYMKRPISGPVVFLTVLALASGIGFFVAFAYPSFTLVELLPSLEQLPKLLNVTQQISTDWVHINLVGTHACNCTDDTLRKCDEVLTDLSALEPEPEHVQCVAVADLTGNLTAVAKEAHALLRLLSGDDGGDGVDDLSALKMAWSWANISLFPYASKGKSPFLEAEADVRSVLGKATGDVIITDPDAQVGRYGVCNTVWINTTRDAAYDYFNRTVSVLAQMVASLSEYQRHTEDVRDSRRNWYDNDVIYVFMICFVLVFLFLIIRNVVWEYIFYQNIKKHFRPSRHPYDDKMEPVNKKDVKRFRVYKNNFVPVIVPVIIILILFAVEVSICRYYVRFYFRNLIGECQALVATQNVSMQAGISMLALAQLWQFPPTSDNTEKIDNFKNFTENFGQSIQELMNALSPRTVDKLRDPNAIRVNTFQCNASGWRTLHDIYRCWPVIEQLNLAYIYMQHMFNMTNITADDTVYMHIQHIYLTHITGDLTYMADQLTVFAEVSRSNILLVLRMILFFVLFNCLVAVVCEAYFVMSMRVSFEQLARVYQVLPPEFIASESCLVSCIIKEEKTKRSSRKKGSIRTAFEDTGVAIVVISDRYTIISFTKSVQAIFGYRAEQLIGQQITLLIPKKSTGTVNHNILAFYQQIQNIKKRQAEQAFTRELVGRSSDGSDIQLQVKVTLVESEGEDCFVLEMKSLFELFCYDELIQKHKEIYDTILSTSVPLTLFPDLGEQPMIVKKFSTFILLYIYCPRQELYASLNAASMDLSDLKGMLETIVPLFDGKCGMGGASSSSGSCVINTSCSHAFVLFVDTSPDFGPIFESAWRLAMDVIALDNSVKSGMMLYGTDIDLALFAPPAVPQAYASEKMPVEETRDYVPTMSVEPITPLMGDVPDLCQLLKPNTFMLSKNLAEMIEDVTLTEVPTELPYSLMSFSLIQPRE